MDLNKDSYIILEIIPTGRSKDKGKLIQLSALKLDGLKLVDRFDYRMNEDNIEIKDFIDMISYDKNSFIYKDTTEEILDDFKKWANNLPLLIIDNDYTINFLEDLDNKKESIFKYLEMEYSDNVIDEVISKYELEPSNYIVDLLYEALIKHL